MSKLPDVVETAERIKKEFFEHWGNIMEDRDLAEVLMDNPEGLFQDRVEDDDQEEEILNKLKERQ